MRNTFICTLEFMDVVLREFYSKDDYYVIKKAFDARNATQYYIDKIIAEEDYMFIMNQAPFFVSKSKDIISKINENHIKKIRNDIANMSK